VLNPFNSGTEIWILDKFLKKCRVWKPTCKNGYGLVGDIAERSHVANATTDAVIVKEVVTEVIS